VHCYTLFATHYHELVPFSAEFSSLKIAQVEVQEEDDAIRFTHRLIDGASGSSFGIDVAKIAGIPASIIARARQLMTETELFLDKEAPKKRLSDTKTSSLPPLELGFVEEKAPASGVHGLALQRILERLERTNILKTTPIQALTILDELKGYLEQKDQGSLFPEAPNLC
jgi:DNA mismatch repair protein MutS